MKISGVYKIINKVNGNYYVGGTVDLYGGAGRLGRLRRHKRDLRNGNHYNKHLQAAWNKYGESNFEFMVVETVDRLKVIDTEQKYLNIAQNEKDRCYNGIFSASICNQMDSPDWRRQLSLSGKRKIFTEKHKKNISKNRSGIGTNPTVFNWQNKKTGELFSGSMSDFYKKYGIRPKYVVDLKMGYRKSYLGWVISASR